MSSFSRTRLTAKLAGIVGVSLIVLGISSIPPSLIAAEDTTIVGGTTSSTEWPWIVALLASDTSNKYNAQFCGGTLIHPQIVLSAAHCMFDTNNQPSKPSDIDVMVGENNLNATGVERISVADIIIHPNYDDITSENDIALLILAHPVTGKTPLPLTEKDTVAGTIAKIIGWGSTKVKEPNESSIYPVALREANVPVVTNAVANQPASYYGTITSTMLAAGYQAGGIDTCSGDSGGPLMVTSDSGWALAGITSFGDGCALPDKYGIYTRVYSFRNWVYSMIAPGYAAAEASSGAKGLTIDTDGDGLPNFVEYALGQDPNKSSLATAYITGEVNLSGQNYVTLTFKRLKNSTEAIYELEQSEDLISWTPLTLSNFVVGVPSDTGDGYEQVTVHSSIPLAVTNPVYLRLKVGDNPVFIPPVQTLIVNGATNSGKLHVACATDPAKAPSTYYIREYRLSGISTNNTVRVSINATQIIPRLQLKNDSTGVAITPDSSTSSTTSMQITFTAGPGVPYRVVSTSGNAGQTGDYTLSATIIAAQPQLSKSGQVPATISRRLR